MVTRNQIIASLLDGSIAPPQPEVVPQGSGMFGGVMPSAVLGAQGPVKYATPAQPNEFDRFVGGLIRMPIAAAQSLWGHVQQADDALWGRYPMEVEDQYALGEELAGMATGGALGVPGVRGGAGMGIRAYHGSPHDFDRFSMDKIGTGEGAQAYGRGLYFAENEPVARAYRDNLAAPEFRTPFDSVNRMLDEEYRRINRQTLAGGQGKDAADVVYQRLLQQEKDAAKAGDWEWWSTVQDQKAAVARIRDENPKPSGRMYEVDIDASPDEFLDWDKPLSEQSPKVQRIIEESGLAPTEPYLGDFGGQPTFGAPRWADTPEEMEKLRNAGIKGIRYKDAGSRSGEGGTHNYVVFDDNIINILRKYGIAGLTAGGAAGLGLQTPEEGAY